MRYRIGQKLRTPYFVAHSSTKYYKGFKGTEKDSGPEFTNNFGRRHKSKNQF
jgi:hypothetical protein